MGKLKNSTNSLGYSDPPLPPLQNQALSTGVKKFCSAFISIVFYHQVDSFQDIKIPCQKFYVVI